MRKPESHKLTKPAHELTKSERDAVNALRPPSQRIVDPEERCGAKLHAPREDDAPRQHQFDTCQNKKGQATDHPGFGYCKFHGGSTPAGEKSAARNYGREWIQRQKTQEELQAQFGGSHLSITLSPEEALLEEVRRSVAMVRFLEERIGTWQYAAAPQSAQEEWPHLGGLPILMGETSRGAATFTDEREWLMLYREERKHSAQVSSLAINAGLAERMVRIAENQGQILASVIRAVLDALGLTPQQLQLVPQVVPDIIRKVTSGQSLVLEGEKA